MKLNDVTNTVAAAPPAAARGLGVKLAAPWERAFAGQWIPLTVLLTSTDDDTRTFRLESIRSEDPAIELDADLFQHQLDIRPGETYRFTVGLRVAHPRKIDLKSIRLFFKTGNLPSDVLRPMPLPSKQFLVKPALKQEIATSLKTICSHADWTKVILTLHHQGATEFDDLAVNFGPMASLHSGKASLKRSKFKPGDREQVELIVTNKEIEIALAASSDGQRIDDAQTLTVEAAPTASAKLFRFLEPTRMAKDAIRVFRIDNGDKMQAQQRRETFLLESGFKYLIEIEPTHADVTDVKMNEVVPILRRDRHENKWSFTIELTSAVALRKSERIYYEVETDGGRLTGEIPICLLPNRWLYWKTAGVAGLTATLQGFEALRRALLDASFDPVQLVTDFDPSRHVSLLLLGCIPLFWCLYRAADWIQYQFANL